MPLAHQVLTAKQKTDHIKQTQRKSIGKLHKDRQKEQHRQQWSEPRKRLYELVRHQGFEAGCGVIILFNMILVVFETDAGVDDGEPAAWVSAMTNILLCIYTVELLLKFYVYRLAFFKDMWNVLDFLIVGVDIIFILMSLVVDKLPSFSVLRVFRLVRLARVFKAAKSLHELHSLLRACACALKAIFWGMVMMGLTLTVWGILSVQLIHPVNTRVRKNKPWLYADCDRCPRAFSTVFDSVLTIWKQIVAGDSWGTLCEPIVEEESWTFLFFVLVLVTVALTMLNCILAVVVEAGAAAAAADEHEKAIEQEKVIVKAEEKLVGLCQQLDSDNSGSLSIKEFLDGFKNNDEFKQCLGVMHVTEDDMFMIFNICDEDDSGDVDYKEFVDQLRRIKHSGEQMLLHYVTDIRHVCNKIGTHLQIPYLREKDRVKDDFDEQRILIQWQEEEKEETKLDESKLNVNATDVTVQEFTKDRDLCMPDGQTLQAGCVRTDNLDDYPSSYQEQLEHIRKTNHNVAALLEIVARQSKDQVTLLESLMGTSVAGTAQSSQICETFPDNGDSKVPSNVGKMDGSTEKIRTLNAALGELASILAPIPRGPHSDSIDLLLEKSSLEALVDRVNLLTGQLPLVNGKGEGQNGQPLDIDEAAGAELLQRVRQPAEECDASVLEERQLFQLQSLLEAGTRLINHRVNGSGTPCKLSRSARTPTSI